jgi:hypothetical protein
MDMMAEEMSQPPINLFGENLLKSGNTFLR